MKMLQVALIGLFLLTGACGPIMPEGFRNLAIGMTWKELIQARPDAIIGSLDPWIEDTPDPEKPRKGLSEMINTGPIKGVLYVFNDGRLSSLSFIYSSEIGIDDSLLRELLDRYGEYENIQASSETGRGIVKWITGNLYLYLVKPFENEEGRDEDVVYQIMDMQMAQEIEAVHSAKLRKKPVDKIGLQVYKSRVQALSNSVSNPGNAGTCCGS